MSEKLLSSLAADRVVHLPLSLVKADPNQPRRVFDKAALEELAADIKTRGVVVPIIVRKDGRTCVIKDGERRHRAAAIAKQKTIPCILFAREQSALERSADQIAANDDRLRKGLNPIELAEHLAHLQRAEKKSLADITKMMDGIGKPMNRSTISNIIRLASLPTWGKKLIQDGALSASHGKYLLQLPATPAIHDQAKRAVEQALADGGTVTVEDLSTIVDKLTGRTKTERPRQATKRREERRAAAAPASAKPASKVSQETQPEFALEPSPPPPSVVSAASPASEPREEQVPLQELPPGVTSFGLLAQFLDQAVKVSLTLQAQGADYQAILVPTLRRLPDDASPDLKRVWTEFAKPAVLRGRLDAMDADLAQHLHQLAAARAALKAAPKPTAEAEQAPATEEAAS